MNRVREDMSLFFVLNERAVGHTTKFISVIAF